MSAAALRHTPLSFRMLNTERVIAIQKNMTCAPFIRVRSPLLCKKAPLQIVVPALMHARDMKLFGRQSPGRKMQEESKNDFFTLPRMDNCDECFTLCVFHCGVVGSGSD